MDSFDFYICIREELKNLTIQKGYPDLPFEMLDEAEKFYKRIKNKQPSKEVLERYIKRYEPKGIMDALYYKLNEKRRANYNAVLKVIKERKQEMKIEKTVDELLVEQAKESGYIKLTSVYKIITAQNEYERLKNFSNKELLEEFDKIEDEFNSIMGKLINKKRRRITYSALIKIISERNPNPKLKEQEAYVDNYDEMSKILTTVPQKTYNELIGHHIGFVIQIIEKNRRKPFMITNIKQEARYNGAIRLLKDRLKYSDQ